VPTFRLTDSGFGHGHGSNGCCGVLCCVFQKLSFEQNLITDDAVSVLSEWTTLLGLQVPFSYPDSLCDVLLQCRACDLQL